MSSLFGRRAKLQAGTSLYDGFRLAFKIEKWLTGKPNNAEIQIWNLAPASREALQEKSIAIILSAGYVATIAQIFSGNSRTVSHVKEKADWISKISAGDGEATIRTTRVNKSFKSGTPLTAIVKQLGEATGLPLGNLLSKATTFEGGISQASHGASFSGPAYQELHKLLDAYGYVLGVQDGALSVVSRTTPGAPLDTLPAEAVVISASTGMIGSPEIAEEGEDKKKVLKVKSLLQPRLVPGAKISLDSLNLKGFYRIEKVTHTGDTFGNEWSSALECKAL